VIGTVHYLTRIGHCRKRKILTLRKHALRCQPDERLVRPATR